MPLQMAPVSIHSQGEVRNPRAAAAHADLCALLPVDTLQAVAGDAQHRSGRHRASCSPPASPRRARTARRRGASRWKVSIPAWSVGASPRGRRHDGLERLEQSRPAHGDLNARDRARLRSRKDLSRAGWCGSKSARSRGAARFFVSAMACLKGGNQDGAGEQLPARRPRSRRQ